MPRKINLVIIHCSDSPNGRKTTVQDIDGWHRARGFERMPQWRAQQIPDLTSIGYHFVIYTTGEVVKGRHVDEIGAHVQGYNATSIGICLIGRDRFSTEQWKALKNLTDDLQKQYPQTRVSGHRVFTKEKTCPNFDVEEWQQLGCLPLANQIYTPVSGAVA
jgi:hypothetical protein